MNVLNLLLYPFAAVYNGVMRFRNHLYDIGQKPSFEFETTVITVGNLNVGGSGKTPMVEYLIRLLQDKYPTVILSRGYKRETTGYRIAAGEDSAKSIGDEPWQMFKKYGDSVHVAVAEDRVYAIPNILLEFPETRVLVLDDALQQRSIRPNLSILLTDGEHPFYKDYLLPFGRLRESRGGARRADVIVMTKCESNLSDEEQEVIAKRIRRYAGDKPVFFATVGYDEPRAARQGKSLTKKVVLVTGIANAGPMQTYCASRYEVIRHFRYADHHKYTLSDLVEIERYCQAHGADIAVLTTEKDMAKLECPEFSGFLDRLPWFSLPIKQVFLKDGSKFDALVLDAVQRAMPS